ncbi:SAV_2336 family protein [Streptomyces cyaneofuscatus]|uniref:SAV_2336 N-terminal domain-related protein n=1 Tax=Streptomyces cyaneofuscatus TaxID=66883 RepID=UPI00386A206D|nr:SAV_2336 family protein [Streptomyces cyaneofuscatus]
MAGAGVADGPAREEEADTLASVLRVLRDAGQELDPQQILDVLWLAGRLPAGPELPLARTRAVERAGSATAGERAVAAEPAPDGPPGPPAVETEQADRAAPELFAAPLRAPARSQPPPPPPRFAAAGSRSRERSALPLRVPEFKGLADELALGRALRPLKQKRPSRWRRQLDEAATAAMLAETGLPDVVMRPARERWLDLVLVVDDGLSMLLWHRLAAELRTMMQRLGAFRSVRFFGLDTRAAGPPLLTGRPFDPGSGKMPATVVTDPSGQTLIMVVSDGMGTAWRQGSMHDVLQGWAEAGPVALVHALPPHLWEGSGIQAERWQATTHRPGGASAAWEITDRVLPAGLADFTGVPVPVLEPSPAAAGDWARLLTSPGTTVELPLLARPRLHAAVGLAGTEGEVQSFRDAATPGAYRLAAHLAAVSPVSVPVMRLVQSAVPWRAGTGELAEVFLGGLLRQVEAPVAGPLPAQHRVFDFDEDVRGSLLDTVPRAELLRTSRDIGRSLGRLAGRSPDFPAWLAHPDGMESLPAAFRSFTVVERRLLARFGVSLPRRADPSPALGEEPAVEVSGPGAWGPMLPSDPERLGPYRLLGRRPGSRTVVYLGRDGRGGTAAVRAARPELPAATAQLLTTEAEALRRLNGRYAPALLATGLTDRPAWIAVELMPSWADRARPPLLRDLLREVPPGRQSALDILGSLTLGWQLADALALCHLHGLVPSPLTADRVLVTGRSVSLAGLSDCAVDGEYAGDGPAPTPPGSIRELGELLRLISTKRTPALHSSQDMQLWQGDTWQPLRDQVMRCLDHDPTRRPSASETAGVLARYVAIISQRVPDSDGPAIGTERPRDTPRRSLIELGPPSLRAGGRALGMSAVRRWGRDRLLVERAGKPLAYGRRITLIGAHRSCGRSTTTHVLGAVIATVRGRPVLALDGAPDVGEVYSRLTHRNRATVRNLTTLPVDAPYERVRSFTTPLPSGLEVLAHSAFHAGAGPAYPDEYRRVLEITDPHYPVVLTDWASPRLGAPAQTVLDMTDRLVVCCTTGASSLDAARRTLDAVEDLGYPALSGDAVVVATRLSGTGTVVAPDAQVKKQFPDAGGPVVVPFDPYLSGTSVVEVGRMRSRTVAAFLELAARVVDAK